MAGLLPDPSPDSSSELDDLAGTVQRTIDRDGNGFDLLRSELRLEMNRDIDIEQRHPFLGTAATGGRFNIGWSTLGIVFAIVVVGGGALFKTFSHHLEHAGVSKPTTEFIAISIVIAVLCGAWLALRRPVSSWSLARKIADR